MQINVIIKKESDFENNHDIPLTLYFRHINLRIKDSDMIIR